MQALKGEKITVYGDGSQTRSFCYVDDMIDGLIRLMDSPDHFTGPVNLGTPYEFTILQLAKLVIKLTGSKSRIVYKPLPADDPKQRKADITLAKTALNWQSKTPLEKGLGKTIQYFRKLLKGHS
jgi:UDP-glucuronate decarboxylase